MWPPAEPLAASTRAGARLVKLAFAALALVPAAAPARVALPDAATDPWVEARTERFTVYSNAGEPAAARAARHLERLAQVLASTTRGLRVDGGREVRVVVFKDLASFKPYRSGGDDEFGVTAGFHVSAPDAELIAFFMPVDADPMSFAAHEYIHAVLARSLGDLPVWINEGLAEFYSTFRAGTRTADIGRAIPEHVGFLHVQGTIPLRELLQLDTHSRDYNEGRRRGTVYAESWALVHMLVMEPGTDTGRFPRLLGALGRGSDGDDALREAYGPAALDSLERALGDYARRTSMSYSKWTFAEDLSDVPVRTRELDSAETLTLLGELAMRSGEVQSALAREHLEGAWQTDSTAAVAAGVLCELETDKFDDRRAERWAAAAERAPKADPRARALAGSALAMRPFHRGYVPAWPARGADATALRARRLLEAAIEAGPKRSEWLVPNGLTFLEDTANVSLGVGALMSARDAEPARVDAIAGLSVLQSRIGNRAGALALYRELRSGSGDASAWRYWAGYALARRTLDDAQRRARAGARDEAETLLVRLQRDVRQVGVAEATDRMLAWVRDSRRSTPAPDDEFEVHIARTSVGSGAGGRVEPGGGAIKGARPTGEGIAYEPDLRVGKAMAAARGGDFVTAERLLDGVRRSASGPRRAALDTLAAEVRNQRRMRAASDLLRGGRASEACALYEQIVADMPKPAVREYVERQRERYCGKVPSR